MSEVAARIRIWQSACEGLPGLPLPTECHGGLPALVKLTVRTPTDEVTGVRRVRLRFQNEQPANDNPAISGLFAVSADGLQYFDASMPPVLPRGRRTPIGAVVDPSEAETYEQIDAPGVLSPRRERLILSWFVETGNTKYQRTEFIEGSNPLDVALTNDWQPFRSSLYPPDMASLFVVLRDDREGISWMVGTASLDVLP